MNISIKTRPDSEVDYIELARRRANPKIKRKLLELFLILSFGLIVVHEYTHIFTAYLIGFDMSGWHFYIEFPYVRWYIPNAPSSTMAPLEWFVVRLSGPLMEGIFFSLLSMKKSHRHILFLAVYAFVYSVFESMHLLSGIYTILLSVVFLIMVLCSYLSMERKIDQMEISRIRSEMTLQQSTS